MDRQSVHTASLPLWLLITVAVGAAMINMYTFYPGIYHHDAWSYVSSVRSGNWSNWQPPLLGVLWVPLQAVWSGPQPMLALFLLGYWSSFVLLAHAYRDVAGRLIPWLVFATAFYPLALNFNSVLVKDIAMTVCLLSATGIAGLLLRGRLIYRHSTAAAMWLLIIMGGFLRANAVFALPPLIDLALCAVSRRWRAIGLLKRLVVTGIVSLLFIPGHMLADRYVFRVKDIKPITPLQIFDIGGIAYYSGHDGYKGFFGPDFIAKNRGPGCYTPRHWDNYGWGKCAEVYENLKPKRGAELTALWLDAILAEPVAYIQHRLAHTNRFFQFLCRDCQESVFVGRQSDRQQEVSFERNPVFDLINWLSFQLSSSPLGPPYVYLLICLSWMWASFGLHRKDVQAITFALTAAGAMYAAAFFVVGVAHEFRYIYPTMLCALIATPIIVRHIILNKSVAWLFRVVPLALIVAVILFREMTVRFVL